MRSRDGVICNSNSTTYLETFANENFCVGNFALEKFCLTKFLHYDIKIALITKLTLQPHLCFYSHEACEHISMDSNSS